MNDLPIEPQPKKKKRRLPLAVRIIYAFFFLSIPFYILFWISPAFADFFNRWISPAVRATLAYLTNLIPFSLAELLILLLPVVVFLAFRYGYRRCTDTWRDVGRFCACVGSAAALILTLFTFGMAPAYRGTSLDKRLGLNRRAISREELYETAMILADKVNEEARHVTYRTDGFSVMPYDFGEMNDKLLEAFDAVDVTDHLYSRIKPVMLSKPMSYTHITGVYTFFTGEANLNVYFPDYTLPFTAAHELAHQRGIAREDEANFVAFLVCSASEYSYMRYVAYLNLYEYVAGELYRADPELYRKVSATLSLSVKGELSAFSRFFEPLRDSVASEVSDAVNDTFLTIHGTEGVRSYGMVVDLAVAYFIPEGTGERIQ
ncbi:MAG: DUF3810 domain-containing protein [Clostridia bacterium]|nr:DUF3810 domain-containing protein [Clostridia bacterium]